jgi:hypothetical protein
MRPIRAERHAETVTATSTDPRPVLDAELLAALGDERAAAWNADRGPQRATVRVAREGARIDAALLETRRPATAAAKIAEVWHAPGREEALIGLVEESVAAATARGDAAVKWQTRDGSSLPERLGFTRMRAPYPSAAGTEGVDGHLRWLRPVPHDEPRYYAQTSGFTCGAVTALLAAEAHGAAGFAGDGADRDRELELWRSASNYPACEPVGLGVALRRALPTGSAHPVEVFLDTEGPALLEAYPEGGFDRAFREELQADSLRQAGALGVPVRRDRVTVEELVARLVAGEQALLLIDCTLMYGFPAPHWVLAHAAASDVVVLEDPWISASWGETWVDTHELPVAIDELDRMLAWGPDGYRGVVVVRPAR